MINSKFKVKKIKIIKNPNGNLYKMISKDDLYFKKFGEIYFSEVLPKKFKGWKFHEKRTQLITVINGSVRFYIKKNIEDKPETIDIKFPDNMNILKIMPKTFYSFKCMSKKKSLIINLIDEVVK
ncbi:WxcM-like domain-containing protein [Candidatus Pelagibacter sp.]|uniref:WxcM-like domain-containing protein n=1 Tax=Candidatus Pelagibacter sp. TaxID=2024849 RepID=UPI003F861D8C